MTGPGTAEATGLLPQLADVRLDRICGIAVGSLPDAGLVRQALDEQDSAWQVERAAAPPLLDAIYQLVPQCPPRLRRRVLHLRRAVHGGRPMSLPDQGVLLAAGVPDLELKTWLDASDRLVRATALLDRSVARAVTAGARQLRSLVTQGPVARALTLVAPEFAARAGTARFAPGDRAARTAYLFAMRAAWKPSPLGHLTAVALSPVPGPGRTRTSVPVGLVHRLFTALAGHPDFADAFSYRPAPALDAGGDDPAAVVASVTGEDGFCWYQERTATLAAYTREWAELATGSALPAARRSRYLQMGLLTAVPPWAPGSDRPLLDLAAVLRTSRSVQAPEVAALLEDLQTRSQAVAGAADPDRPAAIAAVRTSATAAIAGCGARSWSDAVLHEDVGVADTTGPLPPVVAEDLHRLGQHLRPGVLRSLAYDVVVAAFRDRVGRGGRVADAAAFFAVLAGDPALVQAVREARRSDLALPCGSDRAWLPVGRSSAPPALAVHYQLAAASRAAMDAGRYTLVVNQCGSALGGLLTRFHRVLPDGSVAAALRPWWKQLYPDSAAFSMSVSTSVNSLQHNGCGVLPEMIWPYEPHVDRPGQPFDEVGLLHDPGTDVLEFVGADGRPVSPVYTGIVPAALCTGAAQLALIVSDPWIDASVVSRSRHPFLRVAAAQAVTETVATPRRQQGRVVLSRALWQVPAADFPRPERGESDARYLRRLDGWRRALHLPEAVFLVAVSADPFDGQRRKPLHLDFADPFAVRAAVPLVEGACGLRLEEVLPTAGDAWQEHPDGGHLVEHISLLAWDRPTAAGEPS